jgi:hypothetical protein
MTNYLAGIRTIYVRTVGRQRTSVEVAALRQLGLGRRIASMGMFHRRTSSPTVLGAPLVAGQPAPRNPLNQEK